VHRDEHPVGDGEEQGDNADSDQIAFETPLEWPVTGPISGVYGSQRILNGEPRAPHLGVDIAAPAGTPIKAAAAGTVALAEPDLYFTGGTVIIDHGYGLSSIYQHMSRLDVSLGQHVEQGDDPVGGRRPSSHRWTKPLVRSNPAESLTDLSPSM